MKEMGKPIRAGRNHRGSDEARGPSMEEKGLHLFLRHAGRSGADRQKTRERYAQMAYAKAISEIAGACEKRTTSARTPASRSSCPRFLRAMKCAQQASALWRCWFPVVSRPCAAGRESAGMGFNIDAEEADRLSQISLDVIEKVLSDKDPALAGWDGFGVVVQAYGHRAGPPLSTGCMKPPTQSGPQDHGPSCERRLLGQPRSSARRSKGLDGLPRLHPQGRHRRQLHCQRQESCLA